MLIFLTAPVATGGDRRQLSMQDLFEKVAGTACRLEERPIMVPRRLRAREHVLDHVEHGLDLTLVGVHLGQAADPSSGLDLRAQDPYKSPRPSRNHRAVALNALLCSSWRLPPTDSGRLAGETQETVDREVRHDHRGTMPIAPARSFCLRAT